MDSVTVLDMPNYLLEKGRMCNMLILIPLSFDSKAIIGIPN